MWKDLYVQPRFIHCKIFFSPRYFYTLRMENSARAGILEICFLFLGIMCASCLECVMMNQMQIHTWRGQGRPALGFFVVSGGFSVRVV